VFPEFERYVRGVARQEIEAALAERQQPDDDPWLGSEVAAAHLSVALATLSDYAKSQNAAGQDAYSPAEELGYASGSDDGRPELTEASTPQKLLQLWRVHSGAVLGVLRQQQS
jgi:hypothetical protein